ncbi:hypothetical protein K7432_009182 [Basidiobolus ranarum]|uniref:Uncharacterized protein n=1 Tax=Basidiobolus ranarum TaxID=34480 RepID=A0ABR2VXK8_9FUNG
MKVIAIISLTIFVLRFAYDTDALPTPNLSIYQSSNDKPLISHPTSMLSDLSDTNSNHSGAPDLDHTLEKRFWNMRYYCGGFVCGHSKRQEMASEPDRGKDPEASDTKHILEVNATPQLFNLFKRFWNMRFYCGGWACIHAKREASPRKSVARHELTPYHVESASKVESLDTVKPTPVESSIGKDRKENIFKRFWNMRYYCGGWVCAHTR